LNNKLRVGAVTLIVFLFILLFDSIGFFRSVENLSYDLRLKWSTAQPPDSDIAIIAIDDKSIEALGRWPWERDIHTRMLESLFTAQPRVVVFDVLFSESSSQAEQDQAMGEALKKIPQVVLAEYGQFAPLTKDGKIQVVGRVRPIEPLQTVSSGHINVLPDEQGAVRRALYSFEFQGEHVPSIDQLAVESYTGFPIDADSIPLDRNNRWLIPFLPEGSFPVYSYIDVLNGNVPEDALKDRLLLIGPTSVGLFDRYATPVGTNMNGVEIHAHIINALLQERYFHEVGLEWLFLLVFVLIGQLIARYANLRMGVLLVLFAAVLYSLASLYLVEYQGIVVAVVSPLAGLIISYASQIGLSYYNEQKERQQVTRLFGRFVAPQVVDEILRVGEQNVKLGGVRRDIAVLFLDVRGFTPLSENLQPEEVVDVLNSFFDDITKAIFDHGGTLDKFIGDAVMAIFNAPLKLDDYEVCAVRAAIQIQRNAKRVQQKIEQKYGHMVAFGIGVHSGEAIVGNIGAMQRLDYTAIGDTVNLAARLESNAKPNQIIISERVYNKMIESGDKNIRMTSLGAIQVKGKSEPVKVYEVHVEEANL
jgi:adenylate cyclase